MENAQVTSLALLGVSGLEFVILQSQSGNAHLNGISLNKEFEI